MGSWRFLGLGLMAASVVACVFFWHSVITLTSGATAVRVGPDTIIHDSYVRIRAPLPLAVLFAAGLAMCLFLRRKQ